MAVKSAVPPTGIVAVVGLTVIELSVTPAAVTVRTSTGVLVIPLRLAVMFDVPTVIPVASPPVAPVTLMVATAGVTEFQLT